MVLSPLSVVFSFHSEKIRGFHNLAVRAGMFFGWHGDRSRGRVREGQWELSFCSSSSPSPTTAIVNTATAPYPEWMVLHGVHPPPDLSVLLPSSTTTISREMCSIGFSWFTVDCCFAGWLGDWLDVAFISFSSWHSFLGYLFKATFVSMSHSYVPSQDKLVHFLP